MPTSKKIAPSPSLPFLAENVRKWRLNLGFKQAQLEQKAGLSHNTLSRIENGVVSPRPDTLEKIAQVLELDLGVLMFRAPPESIAETKGRYEVAELAGRLESLDDKKLQPVLDAFNTLLDQIDS